MKALYCSGTRPAFLSSQLISRNLRWIINCSKVGVQFHTILTGLPPLLFQPGEWQSIWTSDSHPLQQKTKAEKGLSFCLHYCNIGSRLQLCYAKVSLVNVSTSIYPSLISLWTHWPLGAESNVIAHKYDHTDNKDGYQQLVCTTNYSTTHPEVWSSLYPKERRRTSPSCYPRSKYIMIYRI